MPLPFSSRSHGTIAFGFFNIESDMLLLQQRFFFADRFCQAVTTLARDEVAHIEGWRIVDRSRIGDLHGAIAGVVLDGFIGASYRRFPFPRRPELFKQSPEGDRTQNWMSEQIEQFGEAERLELCWDRSTDEVWVGEIRFAGGDFGELVLYVEQGGYPRYREERRPGYVQAMMRQLRELSSPWVVPPG